MERLLSGEAALALGALRAKVQVVRGYPGSPGTGVLHRLLTVEEVDADWSVNEKVACEFCWGAAICGRRSLFCTKSLGLNVALDTLTTLNLVGTRAGFVILTGDDPGAYRSQNEEDSRHFGPLLELPMLEPRSVPESVALIEFAFELSERHALPVLVRITRAFAFHQEETDPVGAPSSQTDMKPVDLDQDRRERRWIASTENVIPRRRELHQKLRAVAEELSRLPWVERSGDRSAPLGLIAGGFMVTKLRAILSTLELREPWELLALSPVYPLPEEPIARFLGGKRRVLILEEGDPILEEGVAAIAGRAGLSPQIYGKRTGPFPAEGELLAEPLAEGLADFFGLPRPNPERLTAFREPPLNPNPRVPLVRDGFCLGCPYVPTFEILNAVLKERDTRGVILADPGCAVRLMVEPYNALDVKISMGSCVAIGAGIARAHPGLRVIACPGDSGFYHSALLGLVEAVLQRAPMLVLVLDNRTTALSGCQPSPTSGVDAHGRPAPVLLPEAFAHACGVRHVRVFDPADQKETRAVFWNALDAVDRGELAFLVMRSPCVLIEGVTPPTDSQSEPF